MRKQKTIKMTASPLDPSLGGSFQPPATHDGDISIVFRGKNMSIHGWDGSAWSTIYTRNGDDKQFAFPHTYQNYYVKSLTGSDETFSASFFSTGKYERSTPLLAGIQRGTKLHDIEEVPIYTASDANKLLTVMSNGSLAWLLANETWMIDGSPVGNLNGREDLSTINLFGNAQVIDGVLTLDGTSGTYATVSSDFAYTDMLYASVWFKTTASGDRRIISTHVRSSGNNGYFIMLNNGQLQYRRPNQTTDWTVGPNGLNDGQWHFFAMSWQAGGSWVASLDGVQLGTGSGGTATGYIAGWDCYVGANPWSGNQPYGMFLGEIDGVVIENNTKTLSEMQAIYNAGRVPVVEQPQSTEKSFIEEATSGITYQANSYLDSNNVAVIGSTTGANGDVLNVDGLGDAGPYRSILQSNSYTVSMWVNFTDMTSNGQWGVTLFADHYRGTPNGAYFFYKSNSTFFHNDANLSFPGLNSGTWRHLVVSRSGNVSSVYVDGSLVGNMNVGSYAWRSDSGLQFGNATYGSVDIGANPLNGLMDGIEVIDYPLSSTEVADLFNAGRVISAAPAGTPNVSGGIEVLETNTLSGDAQVTNYEGLLIQSSGYAQTQSNYWNNATEQTISVWVKPSELGTIPTTSETLNNPTTDNDWGNNGSIIAITRDYAATMRSNGLSMMIASNQILFLGPHQSNTYLIKNYNFEVGTWYKLTLSWNANTMKAYVNGVLVKTLSVSGSVQQGQLNLRVGKHPSVDKLQFKGNILGLTVENVMKSDAEILADYEAQQTQQPADPVGIALNQIEDDTENYGLWYGMTRNLSEGTIVKGSRTDGMLRSLGSSVDLGVRQDTTFTMWLKTGSHSGATELIKWGGWSDTLHKGLYVEHDTRTTISGISSANNAILSGYTDGHIKIKVFDQLKTSSNWYQYTSFFKMPKNIRDNQWHQVVVQFSNVGSGLGNSYAKVYVDGVKITECFRGNDRVGSGADGSLQLRGNIIDTQGSVYVTCTRGFPQGSEFDNITIQNKILTDQDVVDSYNSGRI